MGLNSQYLAFIATLGALVFGMLMWLGLFSNDLDYLSPPEQRAHALQMLPRASMLQAADSCDGGHFKDDETYGYWVHDFQTLLHSEAPVAGFEELVKQPSVLGRLYGLAGLWLTDSVRFESRLAGAYATRLRLGAAPEPRSRCRLCRLRVGRLRTRGLGWRRARIPARPHCGSRVSTARHRDGAGSGCDQSGRRPRRNVAACRL